MIITNSIIITWEKPNRIFVNKAVRIKDSFIIEIEDQEKLILENPNDEIVDAKGQLLMPGLICAHTHFYGVFSRGLYIPGKPPADFPEILQKLWWPLDQSLDKESIKNSALVCMIDAIKHGTTTLFDHHASPNFIDGSLDLIENAFNDTGLRGVVCYEVTDRGGPEKTEQGIAENLRMIQKTANKNGLVTATFGMHASLTLSDETLKKCQNQLSSDQGIHIHVAEHPIDEYDSIEKSGLRVIERLNQYGFLGNKSIVVHGVHMDHKEIDLLRKTNTWISHQPRSNMNNAVGLGNVDSLLNAGLHVCLGNDGFSNAMWDEWRTCYLAHKNWNHDPRRMNGNIVIQMGVYNNSDLATQFFDDVRIGQIIPGAKADLILIDYEPITEMTVDNLPWHIIFGFRDSMVTTTIVDGKLLMKDGELLNINEKEILNHAREVSRDVWARYHRHFD